MMPFHKTSTPEDEYERIAADMRLYPTDHWRHLGLEDPTQEQIEEKIAIAIEDLKKDTIWVNARYQVAVRDAELWSDTWPAMWHLSIKRRDRAIIHDWRVLQAIKNEVIGPEHEAVELYPAESRVVDSANQYHLFVLKDPQLRLPFGFPARLVSDQIPGARSRQRPR